MRFLVTDLGLEDLILGYPWLAYLNQNLAGKTESLIQPIYQLSSDHYHGIRRRK
jgi:hypothetical protein